MRACIIKQHIKCGRRAAKRSWHACLVSPHHPIGCAHTNVPAIHVAEQTQTRSADAPVRRHASAGAQSSPGPGCAASAPSPVCVADFQQTPPSNRFQQRSLPAPGGASSHMYVRIMTQVGLTVTWAALNGEREVGGQIQGSKAARSGAVILNCQGSAGHKACTDSCAQSS